jgi:hypothetical protein
MGTTPAPGVASRRPRRVAGPHAESLSSEFLRGAAKVTGEGANHGARGGRAPLLQHSYGLAVSLQLNDGPVNRRDANAAETDPSGPLEDKSLNGDRFEHALSGASLCAHRVSAVPWHSLLLHGYG